MGYVVKGMGKQEILPGFCSSSLSEVASINELRSVIQGQVQVTELTTQFDSVNWESTCAGVHKVEKTSLALQLLMT